MRIGINRSGYTSWLGGVFHYESVFVDALGQIAQRFSEELVYIAYHPNEVVPLADTGQLKYRGLKVQPLYQPPPAPKQEPPEFYARQVPVAPAPFDPNIVKFDPAAEKAFRAAGIDMLLLLSPFLNAFSLRLPFIMPIFDLNHKIQPEFPEVSAYGETNIRDHMYINACRFATLILTDSETGKDDVLRFYGEYIDADRIHVLRSFPPRLQSETPSDAEFKRVRTKYNLPPRYFFYPAQFWRHKNHALIVRAIRQIADDTGEAVPVVLCGSYADFHRAQNFKEVEALAKELGVADRVRYIGIAPDEDMAALYLMSVGLVMPTFFGPTNIPPLEAWHYGRPVITTDMPGAYEQIGDAGLLVNPRSAPDLAGAMLKLWRDEALGAELVARGRKRLSTRSWDDYVAEITAILTEACERVRSGRSPSYPNN